ALMGIAEARGTVLLAGPAAAHAALLGELVPGVSVVAVGGGGGGGEGGGVSWVRLTTVLPFRDRSLRGVALTGGRAGLVEEGARVLGLAGQLVLEPAPADARTRVEAAGLTVLAEEGGTLVAGRRR
ncbi:MAG: hypothetical protein ACOCVZ_07895, partial [Gemmatimonadota bacterium]